MVIRGLAGHCGPSLDQWLQNPSRAVLLTAFWAPTYLPAPVRGFCIEFVIPPFPLSPQFLRSKYI